MLALLDGQDGKTTEAAAVLDALANDPSRPPSVREAAGLGTGYVRYWAGAYDRAALAFAAVADGHPGGPLADDALYGLGQSFLQLGDPVSAEQVLERTSEMPALGFEMRTCDRAAQAEPVESSAPRGSGTTACR